MIQRLLTPLLCDECGNEYYETGYWHDGQYCFSCSTAKRRQEEERKKELARKAFEITEKYGIDLSKYPDDIPEEIRQEINSRNAGRKPVKYETEYCEILIEEAAEGKTEAEFAARINISQSLLTYWTEKHERFKKAREIANEIREAWFEKNYRFAMLSKIECVPSMMIRFGAAKYGWGDKTESLIKGSGGEIPVVRIVDRDAGFPTETLEPSPQQKAAEGLVEKAV